MVLNNIWDSFDVSFLWNLHTDVLNEVWIAFTAVSWLWDISFCFAEYLMFHMFATYTIHTGWGTWWSKFRSHTAWHELLHVATTIQPWPALWSNCFARRWGDTSFGLLYGHHYTKLAMRLAFIQQLNTKFNTSQSWEPNFAEWTNLGNGAQSGLNFSDMTTSTSASPPFTPQTKEFNESLGTFDLILDTQTSSSSASKPISGRRWCVLKLFVWACLHFSSSLIRIRRRNPSRTVSKLAEAPNLNWWVIYAQEL